MSAVGTDPIADLLTRIRNALAVSQDEIVMPHSKLKEEVLKLLKQAGFIIDYKTESDGFKVLKLTLVKDDVPTRITGLQRLSKPGRRVYISAGDIPRIMSGRGMVVMSTSQGLLDGETARKQKLGGELMCKVW